MIRPSTMVMTVLIFALSSECEADEKKLLFVRDLIADSVMVQLHLSKDAPPDAVRKKVCLSIRGLISWPPESNGIEVVDFELERQEFPEKSKVRDDAEWKKTDLKVAQKVLDSVDDFLLEKESEELIDPTVTMPLPRLSTRRDDHNAINALYSHPALKQLPAKDRTSTRMFRYLDFDLQPDRWYRYRVKLVYTRGEDIRAQYGEWSEVSNATTSNPSPPK